MKYLAFLAIPVLLLSGCTTQPEESGDGYWHKRAGRTGHYHTSSVTTPERHSIFAETVRRST